MFKASASPKSLDYLDFKIPKFEPFKIKNNLESSASSPSILDFSHSKKTSIGSLELFKRKNYIIISIVHILSENFQLFSNCMLLAIPLHPVWIFCPIASHPEYGHPPRRWGAPMWNAIRYVRSWSVWPGATSVRGPRITWGFARPTR